MEELKNLGSRIREFVSEFWAQKIDFSLLKENICELFGEFSTGDIEFMIDVLGNLVEDPQKIYLFTEKAENQNQWLILAEYIAFVFDSVIFFKFAEKIPDYFSGILKDLSLEAYAQ